jgi:cellulose synthase/poly-beta-1,6-N-acetylglucosamine synthase-like glycosyltransferase
MEPDVTIAEAVFWLAFGAVVYAYVGYPVLLRALAALGGPGPGRRGANPPEPALPSVTLIMPVHNEASVIARKLENTAALDYPRDKLEVLVVSDASTDDTAEIVRASRVPGVRLLELAERGGKARALNCGLRNSSSEIVCFSDASIMLDPGALTALMANFADPAVGCASGEDAIDGGGGERLYGRYELGIRRLESRFASIVGASGCFYAQRRSLCREFAEGLAPDFLSVLDTVEQGYRAVSDPAATGSMTSLRSSHAEFQRKVRTILRGIATLASRARMLDPVRHGRFAFLLVSHKLVRWSVPFFLIVLLVANAFLLDSLPYRAFFAAQALFYALAALAWAGVPGVRKSLVGRIALYFTIVNVATLLAWWKFARGMRQEVWDPTKREVPLP